MQALCTAAEAGDAAAVRKLVACRVDLLVLDKKNENGMTPLMYAAALGHLEIAEALVDAGAGVDLQDSEGGSTALHHAAAYNRPAVVRLLMSRAANRTITDYDGMTALERAVQSGNTECAGALDEAP